MSGHAKISNAKTAARSCLAGLCGLLASCLMLHAAEVRSNGAGGGKWSQAATWEESRVPSSADTVVISTGDKVVFDRDDSAAISCASLLLDPESRFEMESAAGKRVLRVAGLVESYGAIRLDGSLSADDHLEIQFSGSMENGFALRRGGSVMIEGFPNLPENRRNVVVSRLSTEEASEPAQLIAEKGCAVDIKFARFQGVGAAFSYINNTGIRPNERLNLTNNLFEEAGVRFADCDSPRFVGNHVSGSQKIEFGISLSQTMMAEIKDNTVEGFKNGIHAIQSESTLTNNTVEKSVFGIAVVSSRITINGAVVRNATETGITYNATTGSIQNALIEGSPLALRCHNCKFQVSNTTIQLLDSADAKAVSVFKGTVTAINCNIDPSRVSIRAEDKGDIPFPLTLMQYLVVGIKGKTPPDAHVRVQTLKPEKPIPEGAADPNVINSPAPILPGGVTPPPRSQAALTVRAWTMDWNGKVGAPPSYRVTVFVPARGSDGKAKDIKSLNVKPDDKWVRPDTDSGKPTVEMSL